MSLAPDRPRKAHHPCGIPAQNIRPQSNNENTPSKTKLKDIPQSHQCFQSVEVMKDKERLKNSHGLEGPKETGQLNTAWIHYWVLEQKWGVNRPAGEIPISSVIQLVILYEC